MRVIKSDCACDYVIMSVIKRDYVCDGECDYECDYVCYVKCDYDCM